MGPFLLWLDQVVDSIELGWKQYLNVKSMLDCQSQLAITKSMAFGSSSLLLELLH